MDKCNPLTDALLQEYLVELGVHFEMEEMTEKTIQMTRKDWKSIQGKIWRKLSGWERKIRKENSSWFTYHHFRLKKNTLIIPRWDRHLEQYGDFPLFFKKDLKSYRSFMRTKAIANVSSLLETKQWLLIKRSPAPIILESVEGQKARWFAGYGSERRELKGSDEAVVELTRLGYTATALATGELGIFAQIANFTSCNKLIGVRGAEFANMIWMDEGSEIFMFMSASFKDEPIQRKLASACSLIYHEIPHGGVISPNLEIDKILNFSN